MSIGGALFVGNSELFLGPLGVVRVGYKGYDLGLTTAETKLTPDQDIKGIKYQQHGTKDYDHVRTGQEYLLDVTLGEISTGLLVLVMAGISSSNTSSSDDTGVIDRSLFQSMLDNESGGLKIAAVDSNGVASTDLEDIMCFYTVIPIIDADLINWEVDTQRGLHVQFRIKWHEFATGESSTFTGGFGYWGDPTDEDLPAITYPDVEAPIIVSATVTAATTMDIVFNENVAFFGAGSYVAGSIVAKVDEVFIIATSAAISTTTVTATFPASTFTSGDVVYLYIADNALEDTETTANVYEGLNNYLASNPI